MDAEFLNVNNLIYHPDKTLKNIVFVPKHYLIVKALDYENFFFRKTDSEKEWQKTLSKMKHYELISIQDYIKKYCCKEFFLSIKQSIYIYK